MLQDLATRVSKIRDRKEQIRDLQREQAHEEFELKRRIIDDGLMDVLTINYGRLHAMIRRSTHSSRDKYPIEAGE